MLTIDAVDAIVTSIVQKCDPPLELVTWQVSLSREREYAAQYLSYIEPSLHDGLSPISRAEEGTAGITKPSPAVVFDIII